LIVFAMLTVTIIAAPVFDQYVGPVHNKSYNTDRLCSFKATDDTFIVLEGNIKSKIRNEQYLCKGTTGLIEIKINSKTSLFSQLVRLQECLFTARSIEILAKKRCQAGHFNINPYPQ
jgi:hypothetical protein